MHLKIKKTSKPEEQPMELQADPLKEVLGELFSLLEDQETQSAAILQFLKDQGIATEEKLAPYLEQAGNRSNVKWRAARKRMEFLLTPIQGGVTDSAKEIDKKKDKEAEQNKTATVSTEPAASKEADQHKDDKHKDRDSEKHETEMAASAKAASGNAAPKADNAASEKTPEPARL
jgi:hypothetical protein